MADDSELDYIKDFLVRVHTTHTIATIEKTLNISMIHKYDTCCISVWGCKRCH